MHGMIVITVLAAAFGFAATAAAQVPIGHRQQANFSPCLWTGIGAPPIGTCNDTAPKVAASCNPDGISTISITRSGFGNNFLQGTFTETVTATIGPQTGPQQPEIQVLASGIRNGSAGFPTGRLLSFDSTFTFQTSDGRTTITGTKSLVDDLQNVGVCREYNNELSHSTRLGSARVTGFFYLANAQVLNYAGTMTTDGVPQAVAGPAETYLANSFATSVGSGGTVNVNASAGHLATSFGTTHPALGSTWWTNTPVKVDETVTVRPAPGVTITFDRVSAPGDTTVRVVGTGDVPPLPSDGTFLAGVPPALYEISTAATFTPPVTICVPYGGPAPTGFVPTLLHYENGLWLDVAKSFDPVLRIVCGEVTSFSPFAAGYRLADTVGPVFGPVTNLVVPATSASGATVGFDLPTAVDGVDGPVAVTCTAASGATFPVGTTPVTCSATDASGNLTTASFTVTVGPFVDPGDPAGLLDLLAQYGAPQSLQSLAANLLRHVQDGNTAGACGNLNAIAKQLANPAKASRLTSAQVLRLQLTLRAVTTTLGCR